MAAKEMNPLEAVRKEMKKWVLYFHDTLLDDSAYLRMRSGNYIALKIPVLPEGEGSKEEEWKEIQDAVTDLIESKVHILDPKEEDSSLQTQAQVLQHYSMLLEIAGTFHKNIRMVQRLYKATDTKLKHLQGIISGFEESPEMINEAGKKFLSKRFIDLGKSLHALLWYQAQAEIWSIKLEVEHAERWLDLPEGANPDPAHLSILPSEVKLIEDMGVQTIRMLNHCVDASFIDSQGEEIAADLDLLLTVDMVKGCSVLIPDHKLPSLEKPRAEIAQLLANPWPIDDKSSVSLDREYTEMVEELNPHYSTDGVLKRGYTKEEKIILAEIEQISKKMQSLMVDIKKKDKNKWLNIIKPQSNSGEMVQLSQLQARLAVLQDASAKMLQEVNRNVSDTMKKQTLKGGSWI